MRIVVLLLLVAGHAVASSAPEQVAKDFFNYLAEKRGKVTGRDITSDTAAQEKFLSARLREALRTSLQDWRQHQPKPGDIPIPPPDNSTFLLAWDPPKLFNVIRTTQTPFTAIVAGRCIWVAGQQYEHEVRPTFFILVFERGDWRVDDIQAAKANFNSDMSLLRILTAPSPP